MSTIDFRRTRQERVFVFCMPLTLPGGYCFGGGHKVGFQLLDWFGAVNPLDPGFPDPLSERWWSMIMDDVAGKNYINPMHEYLVMYRDECRILKG